MYLAIRSLFVAILVVSASFLWSESDQEKQLFAYINAERQREHLPQLKWHSALYDAALAHSRDMAVMHQITHKGSDGSEPHERVRAAMIYASKTAENVAGDINIVSVHTSLMKSIYHRDNILDPDFTHTAAAVYVQDGYLYVTEIFIREIAEHTLSEARYLILKRINQTRLSRNLTPVTLSRSLSNAAQSHVEVQTKLAKLSPMLILDALGRERRGSLLVNAYTTDDLMIFPLQMDIELMMDIRSVGIGFSRTMRQPCESGCYVVALIFSRTSTEEPQTIETE